MGGSGDQDSSVSGGIEWFEYFLLLLIIFISNTKFNSSAVVNEIGITIIQHRPTSPINIPGYSLFDKVTIHFSEGSTVRK